MENHDKIFNQIKTAAENAETNGFPAMENVWSRVEEKLDKKVLKKENVLWKKIAVAASILLIISIGFQYFTSEEKLVVPKNDIVITDTTKAVTPIKNVVSDVQQITNPAIKENPNQIIEKQVATQNQIVINNNYTFAKEEAKGATISDSVTLDSEVDNLVYESNTTHNWVFNSKGVAYMDADKASQVLDVKKDKQKTNKKPDPLVIIDDKTEKELSDVEADDVESLIVLPDPLYIINGVYYTEKELFGPKPTSPYAPLSKLKIETISILQDEKATAIYGEKGKKGVVIITTKTGKPSFK